MLKMPLKACIGFTFLAKRSSPRFNATFGFDAGFQKFQNFMQILRWMRMPKRGFAELLRFRIPGNNRAKCAEHSGNPCFNWSLHEVDIELKHDSAFTERCVSRSGRCMHFCKLNDTCKNNLLLQCTYKMQALQVLHFFHSDHEVELRLTFNRLTGVTSDRLPFTVSTGERKMQRSR